MKIETHNEQVTVGGGQYLGTVDGLVYFNSPQTGSTLTIKENLLTSDLVKFKLLQSNELFNQQ